MSTTIVDSAVEQKFRQLQNNPPKRRFKPSIEVVTEHKKRLADDPSLIDKCLQPVDLHRMLPHLALRPRSPIPVWVEERAKQLSQENRISKKVHTNQG